MTLAWLSQRPTAPLISLVKPTNLHVEGKLTNLLDGSKWSLLVVAEIVDYEVKELKIDLQPR